MPTVISLSVISTSQVMQLVPGSLFQVYEDLYFPEAATGRSEILAILRQKALPKNSRLVLDHVSEPGQQVFECECDL